MNKFLAWLAFLWEWLTFCQHKNYSWPQTTREGWTYVACNTCGAQFGYDWPSMKVLWTVRAALPAQERNIHDQQENPCEICQEAVGVREKAFRQDPYSYQPSVKLHRVK